MEHDLSFLHTPQSVQGEMFTSARDIFSISKPFSFAIASEWSTILLLLPLLLGLPDIPTIFMFLFHLLVHFSV
ncbi:MAG: hypothetical protein C5S45_00035 [Candidatus Methanocomedens sp.]|nr:MAG: hypothetical protein C5S45_00035 [ANME-2 cluster archaeon]